MVPTGQGGDEVSNKTRDIVKALIPPNVTETEAYRRGYNCGLNGANTENCHFSIFSSLEKMKEWERGKADAEREAL